LGAHNLSAQHPERTVKIGWLGAGIAASLMLISIMILLIWTEPIVRLLTPIHNWLKYQPVSSEYNPQVSWTRSLFRIQVVFNRNRRHTCRICRRRRNVLAYTGPCSIFPCTKYRSRVYGIQWGILIGLLCSGIFLTLYYLSGNWKHRKI